MNWSSAEKCKRCGAGLSVREGGGGPAPSDPAWVMAEFRTRKRRQWAASVPVILVMILFIWMGEDERGKRVAGFSGETLAVASVVVVVGVLLFSFWNWRCPACNRYLGRGLGPSFCPKCGAQLK